MARRLADALSIANKAGLVVAGFAKVDELITRERAAVLVHAADAAADGVAKLDRKFKALADVEGKLGTDHSRIDRRRIELGHGTAKCDTCCSGRGRRDPSANRRGTAP